MAIAATQIINLLAIARHGSFTRAADEIGLSQPALSNSIALLERRLGVKVLERSRRGSTLTPYGDILVRRAVGLQAFLDDAETEVLRRAQGIAGPLRIGATPSVLPSLLPLALAALTRRHGAVDIEVIEGLDQTLVPMLRSGEIDIIVGPVQEMFTDSDDIREYPLLPDPFAIGAGVASEIYNRKQVELRDLAHLPWIVPRSGSTYRRHIEALFMNAGVAWPRDIIVANSLPLLEALLRATDRVTVVSPVQLTAPADRLRVIKLLPETTRTIGYKARARGKPSELGSAFIEMLANPFEL